MYLLFLSTLLYAVNNILWKIFVKSEHPLRIISSRAVFTVCIALLLAVVTQTNLAAYVRNYKAMYVLAGSLFGAGGLVMMVTFLKNGSLVRMGYYTLLGTFIAATYTYFFKETPFSFKIILGALLILSGYLVFLSGERDRAQAEPMVWTQHLLLAGMTICFSTSLLIMWECLKIFPPMAIITTQEVVVLLVTSTAYLAFRQKVEKTNPRRITLRNTAVMAIVIFAAIGTGTLGLKTADPFLASVTSIATPVLTVAAGCAVFKDKFTRAHLFSLLIMVLGALILVWPA